MGQVIGTRPPTMAASVEVVKPRGQYDEVVVHPLVLLSMVDHFRRVEEDDSEDKRVVGVLLGEHRKGRLDVTSSFAVPFEEDENDPSIWFLDHSYLEKMSGMFRRINAKEKIVGWYSTGPKIRTNDMMLVVYLSSLIRSVVALHDLINNKRAMKEAEQAADAAAAAKANP